MKCDAGRRVRHETWTEPCEREATIDVHLKDADVWLHVCGPHATFMELKGALDPPEPPA